MKTAIVAAFLLSACGPALAAPYSSLPSALQIQKDIAASGAREVLLDRIYGSEKISNSFLEHVGSGEAQWLETAAQLRPASDAGSSEDLQGSVSWALPRQPQNVLRLLSTWPSLFDVEAICSGQFGFIEQPQKEQTWRRRALKAVSSVKEASLTAVRSECVRYLVKRQRAAAGTPNPTFQRTATRPLN